MKKIALSLMTLGLLQSTAALATAPTPVPAAIAEHSGPIRIAVIRNLGSDDNTTQFVSGALQEGKKLGFIAQKWDGKSIRLAASPTMPKCRKSLCK